jgi:hypothetical protein
VHRTGTPASLPTSAPLKDAPDCTLRHRPSPTPGQECLTGRMQRGTGGHERPSVPKLPRQDRTRPPPARDAPNGVEAGKGRLLDGTGWLLLSFALEARVALTGARAGWSVRPAGLTKCRMRASENSHAAPRRVESNPNVESPRTPPAAPIDGKNADDGAWRVRPRGSAPAAGRSVGPKVRRSRTADVVGRN